MVRTCKKVNLALQGGGAHGAFTWGVLDRVLEDSRIEIEAISGTSAGAVNAAVLADGLADNCRETAREKLYDFWHATSIAGQLSPIQRCPVDRMMGNWSLNNSPSYLWFDLATRMLSPYEFNPLDINPLQNLIENHIDFERVKNCPNLQLFVSATCVRTGQARIFERDELSAKALLASTCIPHIYRAVEIDGDYYWDGGYKGNPVLFPFVTHCKSVDVIIVQINPIVREKLPTSARDILNRIDEITFNSNLLTELRALAFIGKLVDEGKLDPVDYHHMLFHRITDADELSSLGASSKMNSEWPFLIHLHDLGYEAADSWLQQHFRDLGSKSTLDISPDYLRMNNASADPE